MTNMTNTNAVAILSGCAEADIDNEGAAAVRADLAIHGAEQAVANWRRYSAEAGDAATVEAIDTLGLAWAAQVYERTALAYEG